MIKSPCLRETLNFSRSLINRPFDLPEPERSALDMQNIIPGLLALAHAGILAIASQPYYNGPEWFTKHGKSILVSAVHTPYIEGFCAGDKLDRLIRNSRQHGFVFVWYNLQDKMIHYSEESSCTINLIVHYHLTGYGETMLSRTQYKDFAALSLLANFQRFGLEALSSKLNWFLIAEANLPLQRKIDEKIPGLIGDNTFFAKLTEAPHY